MAITLIVNNIPFDYPEQGEQQPWGEPATAWAKEVTTVLDKVKGPYDVLESSYPINSNQSTPADVLGLFFDSTYVKSFHIYGNIFRATSSTQYVEEFIIAGHYTNSTWVMTQEGFGESGVNLDITNGGQIQYTSNNLIGEIAGSKITFRGTALKK